MSESARASRPLFIDTSAFFARLNDRDENYDRAKAVFAAIRADDLAYRPLYTSGYALSELATLINRKQGHATAVEALDRVNTAGITVLPRRCGVRGRTLRVRAVRRPADLVR